MTEEEKFIKELVGFIKYAQVSSGVCCCGDLMDNHSNQMYCGHTPTDMWDYSVYLLLEKYTKNFGHLGEP